MCTWTIFPRSDWNRSDKRRKLHCLRGPSKKQSFWSEYNTSISLSASEPLIALKCYSAAFKASQAALDLFSISLESSFVHLFNTLFEWLVVSSRPTAKAFNNLQQKTCIGYRPVLFCSHLVFASPGSIVTSCQPHRENIFIPTRERNDLNKCLHGWYFSIDWNLKGEPGLSIWLKINSRQAGSSHIWWEY